MAFFMAFPYTDLYQLNLDWLLETVKRLEESIGDEVVNSFNTRSGAVELSAEDVNALMIETVYIGDPGEVISDITTAELQEMYSAGKRMLLLRDSDGVARELYLLDLIGEPPAATATKYIPDISGDVVTAFNNRSGSVALLASDVNGTRIDITWISDPGDSISDLSQNELDEMYNNGVRVLIFVNNLGTPDQLYFLALVNDVVTPQAYSPASAQSGVVSVNSKTGAVVLFGTDITLHSGAIETVDGAVTSIRNNIGTLSGLSTDAKTSLVAAINEVDGHADSAASAAATAQTTADNAATAAGAAQTAATNAASAAATAQTTADNAATAAGAAQTAATNAASAAATAQTTADNAATAAGAAQTAATAAQTAATAAQTAASGAVTAAANVAEDLGDTADLETTVKTDVVSAVNEVNDQKANQGTLAPTYNDATAPAGGIPANSFYYHNGELFYTDSQIPQDATIPPTGANPNKGLNTIANKLAIAPLTVEPVNGFNMVNSSFTFQNIIFLIVNFTGSLTQGSWTRVGTISNYSKSDTLLFIGVCIGNNSAARIEIRTDGGIWANPISTAASGVGICCIIV